MSNVGNEATTCPTTPISKNQNENIILVELNKNVVSEKVLMKFLLSVSRLVLMPN
jgi:hypothetical protein